MPTNNIVWDTPQEQKPVSHIIWDDGGLPSLPGIIDSIKTGAKSLARGAGQGISSLVEGAANLAQPEAQLGKGKIITQSPEIDPFLTRAVNNALPINPKETDRQQVTRRILEGAGSTLATPIPGSIFKQALAGGVGGLGSFLGEKVGEVAGYPKTGSLIGGLVSGGATGFALGPRESSANALIREKSNLSPADLAQTEANLKNFRDTGSTSYTLPDAIPGDTLLKSLARAVAGNPGGEILAKRLQGRTEDVRNLGQSFLDRIGPRVDAPEVANQTSAAANGAMAALKEQRSAGVANRLAGVTVDPIKTSQVYNDLLTIAKAQIRPEAGDAFRRVAESFLDQNGHIITDAQQLNLAIKALKTAAKNPNAPVAAGKSVIPAVDLSRAISAAEQGIEGISPEIAGAMKDFRNFSQGPMAAMQRGPIAKLADKNPLTAEQTPVSRLNTALIGDNEPSTIAGTARVLSSPVLTQGNTVNPLDVARALAQSKLKPGSVNPGPAVRGLNGSDSQKQLDALIAAGGKDPRYVGAPLEAADQLQGLSAPSIVTPDMKMHAIQMLLRPFRTTDMATTLATTKSLNAEVAKLFADGSTAALKRLQEIAQFDPEVRKRLTTVAAFMSAAPSAPGEVK
jgi:hypothetical protein